MIKEDVKFIEQRNLLKKMINKQEKRLSLSRDFAIKEIDAKLTEVYDGIKEISPILTEVYDAYNIKRDGDETVK
jgi:hypothetical protein